jgi:NIPSNAP
METQVRVYRIRPGKLDVFVEEWRRQIAPLRRRFGFTVVAAWACKEDDTFVWVLSHADDFEAADRRYYASAERAALDPDPARHIVETQHLFAVPVPLP